MRRNMLSKKREGLYVLYYTLLLLEICLLTSQIEASKDTEVDDELRLTIVRGSRSLPDRVNICPTRQDAAIDMRDFEEAKTMNCSEEKKAGMCERDGEMISGYPCTCKKESPLYLADQRHCVNNVWLRKGCSLRFGSWRHSTGWVWDKLDDPIPLLHLDDGYGITGGFNASTTKFKRCRLSNVTALSKTGVWAKINFRFDDFRFFVMRRYFHINWNTENLDPESKDTIRGRLLRFSITCEPPEPKFHNDKVRDPLESCLTLKATGNYTVHIDGTEKESTNTTTEKRSHTTAIVLGVVIPFVVISGTVITVVFLKRRKFLDIKKKPRFSIHFRAR